MKSYFFSGCLFLLFFFCSQKTRGQGPSVFDVKNLIPTSPEAAMMGRFGDIPIGYYTGTADISIPIYSIKEANLEIPITLRYHSSGIKVEDEASYVGLGWNLEAEGAIIQIINGKNDPLDNLAGWDPSAYSWLKGNITTGVYQAMNASEWQCGLGITPGYTTALFAGLKTNHGQPDIFQYNFPGGYSGKFFVNPDNGQIILMDKSQDIKFAGGPSGWTATTLDGHIFHFGAIETSWYGDYTGRTFKLDKITFNTGKEIFFEYFDGTYYSYSYSEKIHSGFLFGIDPAGEVINSNIATPQHTTKTLSKITFDDIVIDFNLEDRDDLFGSTDNDGNSLNGTLSTKRIKSVDIKASQRKIKSFNLAYDYFPYSTTGATAYMYIPGTTPVATVEKLGKRLRLLSVEEVGYTSTGTAVQNPKYLFEYNSAVLPLKTSLARDFWGYYNGKNNTLLTPDLSFYYFSGYPEYANMPARLLNINGANRTVNIATLQAGMLNKISYPTGGFTLFEYEPHDFGNYNYPDQSVISAAERSVTVKDQNNSGDTYTSSFELARTQTIRFTVSIQKGPPMNTVTFNDLLGSTVTLTKVTGIGTPGVTSTVLKTWQMLNNIDYQNDFNADGAYEWIEDIMLPYTAGAVYYVTAAMPNAIPPQNNSTQQAGVMAQFKYYDLANEGYSISVGGGLRVKTITNYSAVGNIATKKGIKYKKEDQSSSGLLMSPLKHLYSQNASFIRTFSPTGSGVCPTYQTGSGLVWYLSSESYIPYSAGAGGNAIGYSRVEEIDVTPAGASKGKHIYYYHNAESENHPNVPENADMQNGFIEKEEIKNEAGSLLTEFTYTYENIAFSYFNGVKLVPTFFGEDPCEFQAFENSPSGTGDPCLPTEYSSYNEYQVVFYPLNSKWFKLKSKQTKQFDGATPVTVKEEYEYDSKGLPIQTDVFNSKGEKVTRQSLFPTSVTPGLGTAEEIMAYTNRYNTLLEQKELLNNVEVAKIKYNYAVVPSLPRFKPVSVQRSINGGSLMEEINFGSPASFERVQQYDENGLNHAFIWSDYYRDAVAKISGLGADVAAHAAQTSFEKNQTTNKGGWTYSGIPVQDVTCPTGKMVYPLSAGAITKTGLNASYVYILTYWTKGNALTITGTQSGYPVLRKQLNGWKQYEHQITGQSQVSVSGAATIDELRLYMLGATMTSYTHEIGIGITSEMMPDGNVRYYEYDALGRLWLVKDQYRKILQKICYNYAGQVEDCQGDLTPNWQPNGILRCKTCTDNPSYTTNVQEHQEIDLNPNSPTGNSTRWVSDGIPGSCTVNCPPPPEPCSPSNCSGNDMKCINGVCVRGTLICVSSVLGARNLWTCTYRYCFPDGTLSTYFTTTTSSRSCPVQTCP